MKLLVVDDEAHIRQMMRLTLETAGYEVDEAATGEEGLTKFGNGHEYVAVLLDQKMPGMDGLETLRQLKQRLPEACVIMVTAFASIDLAVDAMRLGATDFLRKPMTPDALRASVAAALASRPRVPLKSGAPAGVPQVETLTLNGFRILRAGGSGRLHTFEVTHFGDGTKSTATVAIDPEAIARVERLTGRKLDPGGAFWKGQAERLLSTHLWTEGHVPIGLVTLYEISREDLDAVGAWTLD
jgi:DNA-binding response OmpR family regulator